MSHQARTATRTPTARQPPPTDRIGFLAVALIIGSGIAARLYEVQYNFDGDELFSVKLAASSFLEAMAGALADQPHPPLHIFLLHFWIRLFGQAEPAARSLSVLCSAAFLVFAWFLFRRFLTVWVSLGLLLVLALSPLFVYYGQQARPYALIALVATVNLLAFLRLLDAPGSRARLAVWVFSATALMYSQYVGILLVGFEAAVAAVYLRGRDRIVILTAAGVSWALVAPWMLAAMGQAIASGSDPLPQISWIGSPTAQNFAWFYVEIFGEHGFLRARWLALLLAVPIVGYARYLFVNKSVPATHLLLLLAAVALPLLVWLVSVWGPKPVFASRQLLPASIAAVVLLGLGISALPAMLAAACLVAIGVWVVAAVPASFPSENKPPWMQIAVEIDSKYGSTTVVAHEGWIRYPLAFYRKLGVTTLQAPHSAVVDPAQELVLFACRPALNCSIPESDTRGFHVNLSREWRWGVGASTYNHIRLYEIERNDPGR
jgi:uncharacterized membrane protein